MQGYLHLSHKLDFGIIHDNVSRLQLLQYFGEVVAISVSETYMCKKLINNVGLNLKDKKN